MKNKNKSGLTAAKILIMMIGTAAAAAAVLFAAALFLASDIGPVRVSDYLNDHGYGE